MRILVTGANGQLGRELSHVYGQQGLDGYELTLAARADLDITDAAAVDAAVAGHDWVVNGAAWTAVDAAESHEDEAYAANALGPQLLARAAERHGAALIQVSTDYVFDGRATEPYREDAPLDPVSAYGRTKAEGERLAREAHPDGTVVVRTAWLYGDGPNFARTMLRLAAERDTFGVVDDQRGQPTWARDLARQLQLLIASDVRSGVFHGTNSGETTWYGFARRILESGGFDPDKLRPITTAEFPTPATRPAYSVLSHDAWTAAGLPIMRHWADAFADAAANGVMGPR